MQLAKMKPQSKTETEANMAAVFFPKAEEVINELWIETSSRNLVCK